MHLLPNLDDCASALTFSSGLCETMSMPAVLYSRPSPARSATRRDQSASAMHPIACASSRDAAREAAVREVAAREASAVHSIACSSSRDAAREAALREAAVREASAMHPSTCSSSRNALREATVREAVLREASSMHASACSSSRDTADIAAAARAATTSATDSLEAALEREEMWRRRAVAEAAALRRDKAMLTAQLQEAIERVTCLERTVVHLRARAESSEAEAASAVEAATSAAAAAERAELAAEAQRQAAAAKPTFSAKGPIVEQEQRLKAEQRGTKRRRPPVPAFPAVEVPTEVRPRAELPPARPEDNYEISDTGECSDEEAMLERLANIDRSHKHVPEWCATYLKDLTEQASIDPDSIFGRRVPACILEEVFPDRYYQRVGQSPPKRRRGSSGNWGKDRLTSGEISDYKRRMGQTRTRTRLVK